MRLIKDRSKGKNTILTYLILIVTFPLAKYLTRFAWLKPNHISGLIFLLTCTSAIFFYLHQFSIWIPCSIYFISAMLDTLDGSFARLTHQTSLFGKLADLVTDRFGLGINLIAISSSLAQDYYFKSDILVLSFVFYIIVTINTISHLIHKPVDVTNINEQEIGPLRRFFYERGLSFPPVTDFEVITFLICVAPMTSYYIEILIFSILIFILRSFIEYFLYWRS